MRERGGRERERERGGGRERESVCVCLSVLSVKENQQVCVYVCVYIQSKLL